MNEKPVDCVELKRQIQESLQKLGPREPLNKWNESVLSELEKDPHMKRFKNQVVTPDGINSRRVG